MSAKIAPAFPQDGYLSLSMAELLKQRRAQQQEVSEECMVARAKKLPAPCVQILNVSLFFDGTNNHGESDENSSPVSCSNIRRLYRSTIRSSDARASGYYTYYIQGVGTVFKEIGEHEPNSNGLKFAVGGEDRILWGLTRMVDCLSLAMGGDELPESKARDLIQAMQYTYQEVRHGKDSEIRRKTSTTPEERRAVMQKALAPVIAKRQQDYKPRVLRIKLFVYGFSRGAAEARSFLWRLRELMDVQANTLCDIPLSVEFVGLFDTVASVGVTEHFPNAEGHMGWADDTMPLPTDFVKQCAHMVSGHEQRLSFPLDSVAQVKSGNYPKEVVGEWVYPGMHSDVGGGYPPGDQGKASEGQGMLLSQLPLLHMYRLAFDAGAPLQVNKQKLQNTDVEQLALLDANESWRFMDDATRALFDFRLELIERFEAWRAQAKGSSLDEILEFQTAQITAWRIARYAGGLRGTVGKQDETKALQGSPFFRDGCKDTLAWEAKAKETEWKRASRLRRKTRTAEQAGEVMLEPPQDVAGAQPVSYRPSLDKEYEPVMDRTQVSEAAGEFANHYNERIDLPSIKGMLVSLLTLLSRPFSEDCHAEAKILREDGDQLYPAVSNNALLMALYDDHVHDSRAWFMYATLGQREPHGSYFRYRTVFFGDGNANKEEMCKAPRAMAIKRQNAAKHEAERQSRH